MASSKHTKIDRQARVAQFRLAGIHDQQKIAKALGVTQPTISRDFAELDAQYQERAAQDIAAAKGVDLDRIEAMIAGLWARASSGGWLAVDRVVKLLERRAALLGLDAAPAARPPQDIYLILSQEMRDAVNVAAAEEGLDPDEVLAQAHAWINRHAG